MKARESTGLLMKLDKSEWAILKIVSSLFQLRMLLLKNLVWVILCHLWIRHNLTEESFIWIRKWKMLGARLIITMRTCKRCWREKVSHSLAQMTMKIMLGKKWYKNVKYSTINSKIYKGKVQKIWTIKLFLVSYILHKAPYQNSRIQNRSV